MSFAAPAALWLLALLPLVVLLHLRRQRSVEVGSVMIWRRLSGVAPQPRPRVARPASLAALLLQLVGVAAMALALARPMLDTQAPTHHLLVIDASLPMQARDTDPVRLESALMAALEALATMDRADRVSIVAASGESEVLSAVLPPAQAAERLQVWATRANASPSALRADWLDAAALLQQIESGFGPARLQLWTSPQDATASLAALAALGRRPDALHLVGEAEAFFNAGFSEVSLQPRSGTGRWTVQGSIVSVGLANRPLSIRAIFAPFDLEGELVWGTSEVTTDRFGVASFSLPVDLPGEGVLELQLLGSDHLALDDRIATLAVARRPPQLLVVGPANPALDRALLSIPGAMVFRSDQLPGDTADYDLIVVDRLTLERTPATSTLYLSGALPPGWATSVTAARVDAGAAREVLRPDAWRRDHPLTRGVDWGGLELEAVAAVELDALGVEPLLSAQGRALLAARTTEAGREVVLAVNSVDAPWLATAAFPALMAAVLDWALPDSNLGEPQSCRVGQPCGLPRTAFVPDWRLIDTEGREVAVAEGWSTAVDDLRVWDAGAFDTSFVPTRPGRFTLEQASGRSPVIVAPVPLLEAGALSLEAIGDLSPGRSGEPRTSAAPRWWQLLAAVAATALVLDVLLALLRRERWLPRRWRRAEPRRRFVAVNLLSAGALLAMLAAALALPTLQQQPLQHTVMIRDATGAALLGEVEAAVVLELSASARPSSPASVPVLDASRALQLLRASAPSDAPIRVALAVADAPAAAALERGLSGISSEQAARLAIPAATPTLVLEGLHVPEPWPAGSSGEVRVALNHSGSDPIEVRLSFAGEVVEVAELAPGAGLLTTTLRAPSEPGTVALRLEAFDPASGRWQLRVERAVAVAPAPAVLIIATEPSAVADFAEALRGEGLRVDTNLPRRFPGNLEALSAYQSVVLADVPAVALHTFHQELLAEWVGSRGGSALLLGGPSAFGAGGYLLTPLDTISPLSSQIPDEAPEVTMVFVLDRSGSMSARVGEGTRLQVAQEATVAALKLLNPDSLVGLVAFDAEAEAIVPMVRASEIDRLIAAVDRLRPGGGTDIYVGLIEAEQLLLGVDSSVLHVVVMTDGITQVGDFPGVLGRLQAMGATTSFIGIGDGADQGQLRRLADLGGGNLHFTRDFRALPAIMALETSMAASSAVETTPLQPSWLEPLPPFALGRPESTPPLEAYVRTTLKPEANLHLVDAELDVPLLASWRYGTGRVAAFASDPIDSWGSAWREDPALADLWSELLRWGVAPVLRAGIELETWYEGETLQLRATLRDEAAAPMVGLRPLVTVVDAAGADAEAYAPRALSEVRPGVYRGSVRMGVEVEQVSLRVSAGEGAPFFLREQLLSVEGPALSVAREPVMVEGASLRQVEVAELLAALRPELGWRWGGDGAAWLIAALLLWLLALGNRYAAFSGWRWR